MSYSCQLSYLLFNNNSGISLKPREILLSSYGRNLQALLTL